MAGLTALERFGLFGKVEVNTCSVYAICIDGEYKSFHAKEPPAPLQGDCVTFNPGDLLVDLQAVYRSHDTGRDMIAICFAESLPFVRWRAVSHHDLSEGDK